MRFEVRGDRPPACLESSGEFHVLFDDVARIRTNKAATANRGEFAALVGLGRVHGSSEA